MLTRQLMLLYMYIVLHFVLLYVRITVSEGVPQRAHVQQKRTLLTTSAVTIRIPAVFLVSQ